jgi:hypothetical protein
MTNPSDVTAGGEHSCAIDGDNVYCWGLNTSGQLNYPGQPDESVIVAGVNHTCVIYGSGTQYVYCWGQNASNETVVPSLTNPVALSLGNNHSCALDDTGVVCWGGNGKGQTNVPSLDGPAQIAAGYQHQCALDKTGVVCWGRSTEGQINTASLDYDFDNDGVDNGSDFCRLSVDHTDTDSDGACNAEDLDDDNDGYSDELEVTWSSDPLNESDTPPDNDGDFIVDAEDRDDDNDGVADSVDLFPFDNTKPQFRADGMYAEGPNSYPEGFSGGGSSHLFRHYPSLHHSLPGLYGRKCLGML